MKRFILLFLLPALLLLSSCGKDLRYADELQYQVDLAHLTIRADDNGKPAEGEFWSRDGESTKLTAKDGKIEYVEYFTNNGKLYCRIEKQDKHFFNANGKEISGKLAQNLYKDAHRKWIEQQKQLSKIVRGIADADDKK